MTRQTGRPIAWLCAFLFVVCTASPARAAGEYRTVEVESLKITIDSEWAPRGAPGYLPVRFDITNLGEARTIEILGHGSRSFRHTRANYTVQRTLRLVRGDRVRFTIPVPAFGNGENVRFEVREDGKTLQLFNYASLLSGASPDDASVLVVANPASAFGKMAEGWRRTLAGSVRMALPPRVAVRPSASGSSTRTLSVPPLDFLLPPERLPDTWLGFTSLRAVAIDAEGWKQLDDEQRRALLTWTACGGDLFVLDADPAALLPPGELAATVAPDRVRAYFFGRIHPLASTAVGSGGLAGVLAKATPLQDANWALPANRARDWGVIAARGFRLPIPGVGEVPARSYFVILLLFSIIIGPANYALLWRRRRQVLVVLTTPLISLAFIGLLGVYVLAVQGIGVRGRAATFTMLDQARKAAATRATASLYAAGMAPRGGLRFARDEAVFTLGPDGTGSTEAQALDLSESQRFVAGALEARSPTNIEFVGFRPARERLAFDSQPGGLRVVNGLGATVRALVYRTGNAVHTLDEPLPPGQTGLMAPGAPRVGDVVPRDIPLALRFEHLFNNIPDGSYLAVLDRSPFWNPGVADLDERDSFHVVIGWVGGQP